MASSNESASPTPAEESLWIEIYKQGHSDFVDNYIPSSPYASFLLEAYTAELDFCPVPKTAKHWTYLRLFRQLLLGLCDDDEFPNVLRASTIEYILFFAREWLPYLKSLDRTIRRESNPSGQLDDFDWYRRPGGNATGRGYMSAVECLMERSRFSIFQRWKKGLMREGQIKLLEIGMRMIVDQMRTLMEQRKGLDELQIALQNGVNLITNFFAADAFRSQRLEDLLLRYLGEEELNRDIAKEIEAKTLEYRREGYRLLCELQDQFGPVELGDYFDDSGARDESSEKISKVMNRTVARQVGFNSSIHSIYVFFDG